MPPPNKEHIKHIVDCDADPHLSDNWILERHRKGGVVELERRGDDLYANGRKVELFLSDSQKDCVKDGYDNPLVAYDLCEEWAKKTVLNTNILDYLWEHQELIPPSWRKTDISILFLGDEYYGSQDPIFYPCVSRMFFLGDRWHRDAFNLFSYVYDDCYVAVSASQ